MANPDGILHRNLLFLLNEERLAQLAHRTSQRGTALCNFVVVMIDVDDEQWRPLVDQLCPKEDWQKIRDQGEKPIMRGTMPTEQVVSILERAVPPLVPLLRGSPPAGMVRAVVMGHGGASVYPLVPQPGTTLAS